jgi:hypothetical protein
MTRRILLIAILATTAIACGKKANPPEKLAELQKATDAYCGCAKEQLARPAAELQPQACDTLSTAWNEVSKSMPVPAGEDPAYDAMVQAWMTCNRTLSAVGK